ncbi:E3 ubiquitin-protein ligase RNF135 [Podarcis raffonei]|uniref:E3 ubiquitin-protein ligase RNF135 n=1 Tax=Podarcis raffonei TaxID=65483 RepID=UPI00232920BA|nr:E3 ubiquitin-protein ligase RNF135 [Podarcis raffonei]
MATAAEAVDLAKNLQDELTCCLCLDFFNKPVLIIKCSHSFCKECISEHCKKMGPKALCPRCRGELRQNNLVDHRSLANIVETYQQMKKNHQELWGPSWREHQAASGSQDLKLSAGVFPYQLKEVVKISDVCKQIEAAFEAIDKCTKDSAEMRDSVSRIKSSIGEGFSFMKKYINDQEEKVLNVIDEECAAAQQSIDLMNEQLTARIDRLLELQSNSEEVIKNTSSEQEVSIGEPVRVTEVVLGVQKISGIIYAVEEFRRQLDRTVLEKCPRQQPHEFSPGTSNMTCDSNDIQTNMAEDEIASTSSSSLHRDSLQGTSCSSSATSSARDSPMPAISSQFSQWASDVTFDPKRVNNMLQLTEDKRKVSVMSWDSDYEYCPKRFRISQVLGSQSFSEGCHYWEVSTRNSTGWAIGVASEDIGRSDKLGRSEVSWCIEWSRKCLSAWHRSEETPISEDRPLQVGVLLDIPSNRLSFYSLADKVTLLHQFESHVVNPVYPAFWIYGTDIGGFLTINDIKRN